MKSFLFIASLSISNALLGAPPPGYKLIWADEFNGKSPDESEWIYREDKKALSAPSKEEVSLIDGYMSIKHRPRGDRFGGGGLITNRIYKSGYFETSVKMDGGYGWHEAFWTWHPPAPKGIDPKVWAVAPRIEIDCFEAKAHNAENEFSYGVIQWSPIERSLSRIIHKAPESLSSRFYTYGFEVSEDYVAFYFDDKLIDVTSLEGIDQSDFNVILSSIATHKDAVTTNGGVLFDYLRCYEISPSDYAARRAIMMKGVPAPGGHIDTGRPPGIDLWIEAEEFNKLGSWKTVFDSGGYNDGSPAATFLVGQSDADKTFSQDELTAATTIKIPQEGTWRLWVRSKDFALSPGGRIFDVAVNGEVSGTKFGAHGNDGFAWEDGGVFSLPAGNSKLELIDSSKYFPRCDRILLTRDLEYIPDGPGGKKNIEHVPADGKIW
jgi:hypothetical protein